MPPRPLPGRLPLAPRLRRRWLALVGLLVAGPFMGGSAGAQPANYPTRPIRLLVGDAAGSAVDSVARALVPQLQAELGQTVGVENRPGRGGAVATQAVADAAGDGHVWLLTAASAALKQAPYSWAEAELMPITWVCWLTASSPDGPAGSSASVRLGLMGPANMHAGVAMRVHAAVQVALASAELQGRLAAVGAQPLPAPRQAFIRLLQAEQARNGVPINSARITQPSATPATTLPRTEP